MFFKYLLIPILVICQRINANPPLETVKQWNLLTYNFPYDWPSANSEFYNPENVVATGIDIGHQRIFISTPRLFSGVPATLSTISRHGFGDSPVLQAYPDWSHHTSGLKQYNCSDIGLVSVYRMRIDSCNRLWALDAGVSRSLEDYEVTCPPKILVYDLNTDRVVRRIDFPADVIKSDTLLTNIIIDETTSHPENHCDDVFVYMTDTVSPGMVVYDSASDFMWRLTHPAMFSDPNFSESNILGDRFTLMDGIVGLAFDQHSGTVYFQPLATDRLFSIPTAVLRAGPQNERDLPIKLVGRKSSQGLALAVGSNGDIIFSPFTETAIAKWSPQTNQQSVLAYDPERLQFAADMPTPKRDPGALYVLTSKFQRFFLKNLDANEYNTRILRVPGVASEYPHQYPSYNYNFGSPVYTPTAAPPKQFSFTNQYFGGRRPYNYESANSIDKSSYNPFSYYNSGENPLNTYGPPNYNKNNYQNHFGGDFNGLRYVKSVSYNTTTRH